MKTKLYFVLSDISKRKFAYILLSIQVIVCVLILNIVICRIYSSNYLLDIVNNQENLLNSVYLWADDSINENSNLGNEFMDIDKNITGVANIYSAGLKIDNDFKNIYMYNKDLINNISIELSKGKWSDFLACYNDELDYIPIIVSKSFKTKYKYNNIYEGNFHFDKEKLYKFKVVGYINNENYYLSFSTGGTFITLADFYQHEEIIICPYIDIIMENEMSVFKYSGSLLFTKQQNITTSILEQFYGNKVEILNMNKIIDIGKNYNSDVVSLMIFQCAIILILTISGLGGTTALMAIESEKNNALYYMCGMKKNWIIHFQIINGVFFILIPAVFGIILSYYYSLWLPSRDVLFSVNNIVYSLLFVVFIYSITSLASMIKLYKSNPIEIIQRWI